MRCVCVFNDYYADAQVAKTYWLNIWLRLILRYTRMYQFINRYIKDHGIEIVQTEFTRPLYWTQGIIGSAKIVFVQHEIPM